MKTCPSVHYKRRFTSSLEALSVCENDYIRVKIKKNTSNHKSLLFSVGNERKNILYGHSSFLQPYGKQIQPSVCNPWSCLTALCQPFAYGWAITECPQTCQLARLQACQVARLALFAVGVEYGHYWALSAGWYPSLVEEARVTPDWNRVGVGGRNAQYHLAEQDGHVYRSKVLENVSRPTCLLNRYKLPILIRKR